MRVAVFSARSYVRDFLDAANADGQHELVYFEPTLDGGTVPLAAGYPAVCAFVHDHLDREVLERLADGGVQLVALRCAGFNNVDLKAASELGVIVTRVPAYSPYAIAEHTVGLILTLNRGIHRAFARVRDRNFALGGLLGFDLHGRTVGIVGTGVIGSALARILSGFGCRLLAYDVFENPECVRLGVEYVELGELLSASDIISLHCPLTAETYHLIDAQALAQVKPGVMLINTSRGALIDTQAVIDALKDGRVGYLGLDVYEEEDELFDEDLSSEIVQDDVFMRLLGFPNVIVTAHQAYFTSDALRNIAEETLANISAFERGEKSGNEVAMERIKG
ncbi:MAG: 2-hydroxyacid dehydrogenase [Solirubrobacteraceae bacterium]